MEKIIPQPQQQSRTSTYQRSLRYTNFYPLYNGANDQVDPVLEVQPVQFQRVLPRYRLSTSETRDLGVGPMFSEVAADTSRGDKSREAPALGPDGAGRTGKGEHGSLPAAQFYPGSGSLEPWKGFRVDLLA